MNRNRILATALAFLGALSLAPRPQDPDFRWETNLKKAHAMAKKERKPLLVVFR